jgi:hypothetical protein
MEYCVGGDLDTLIKKKFLEKEKFTEAVLLLFLWLLKSFCCFFILDDNGSVN